MRLQTLLLAGALASSLPAQGQEKIDSSSCFSLSSVLYSLKDRPNIEQLGEPYLAKEPMTVGGIHTHLHEFRSADGTQVVVFPDSSLTLYEGQNKILISNQRHIFNFQDYSTITHDPNFYVEYDKSLDRTTVYETVEGSFNEEHTKKVMAEMFMVNLCELPEDV